MKSNPILEEVWQIKDKLAAEAGYDIDRFFDNLEKWESEHPHSGPIIRSAEELRQHIAEKEQRRAAESPMVLHESPPPKSKG